MNVESMTAAHAMSRILVVVSPDESPLMAWELMRRADVHHLPVVEDGHVLGILTRERLAASWTCEPDRQSARPVRSLLERVPLPRVRADTPLTRIAALMVDTCCDAVPVLSDGGLIGMVTARDVLSAVAGRVRDAGEPGELITGMFRLEPLLPGRNR
ncbi:HPP family protein [Nonomuraea sp. NPDC049309]|uniref:CBS domain-containing protein n=1 Tax=Nonomuraea sp. NPDC049309 TaxID=3364350 RepID=UPI00371DE27B